MSDGFHTCYTSTAVVLGLTRCAAIADNSRHAVGGRNRGPFRGCDPGDGCHACARRHCARLAVGRIPRAGTLLPARRRAGASERRAAVFRVAHNPDSSCAGRLRPPGGALTKLKPERPFMKHVIDFGPIPALPVTGGSDLFPVGRIYCVGRNYAEHAREMGHDPDREPPFFFMKPANAIVPNGATIPFPQATQDLHHEIELVVALGKGGANIAVEKALDHVWGYGVGLDMTRRDLQGAVSY